MEALGEELPDQGIDREALGDDIQDCGGPPKRRRKNAIQCLVFQNFVRGLFCVLVSLHGFTKQDKKHHSPQPAKKYTYIDVLSYDTECITQ